LEQVIDSAIKGTEVTGVSFSCRFVFYCDDQVTTEAFIQTGDAVTLRQVLLPSRDTLVAWVGRLKARHPQLRAFRVNIDYDLIEADMPDVNEILEFEYHEAAADAEDSSQPSIREGMDLGFQRVDAVANQCRYEVYPCVIRACYDALLRDAETLRQQAALEGDDAQVALPRSNGDAGVPDGAH
jgi:hypothetical protein